MPVGSKYQVFIPSSLAYKDRSAGADIGPNSTLIFEIELLSVNPSRQPSQPNQPSSARLAKHPPGKIREPAILGGLSY